MNRFLDAVESAIATENWYAALALGLTLPDICAGINDPGEKNSRKRYVAWYDHYMLKRYTSHSGSSGTLEVLLSGNDCYALRCAFLHSGNEDIRDQKAQEVLERYYFVAPKKGWTVHCVRFGTVLQLQVNTFCLDMCGAVEDWLSDIQHAGKDIQQHLDKLLYIRDIGKGGKDGLLITIPTSVDNL